MEEAENKSSSADTGISSAIFSYYFNRKRRSL